MFRRRRGADPQEPVDVLAGLEPAWRARVAEVVDSRDRFASLLAQTPAGGLHDRLAAMQPQLDGAVQLAVDVAHRAQAAAAIAATLDAGGATAALKDARRRLDQLRDNERADVAALKGEVDRLAAHHRAVHGALNAVDDAGERISAIALRLRTAVAEAAALVLRPSGGDDLDRLDDELRDAHLSLDALRAAFAELER